MLYFAIMLKNNSKNFICLLKSNRRINLLSWINLSNYPCPIQGSGQLEFEEFCTLAARFLVEEDSEAMQQELREAFRLYDKEGNGYITTAVFRDILHELDDKLTPQELDMMIEEIDADGSGTLDFDGRRIILFQKFL